MGWELRHTGDLAENAHAAEEAKGRADRSAGSHRSEGASYKASRTRDSMHTTENRASKNGSQAGRIRVSECVGFGPVQRASLQRAMETEWRRQEVPRRAGGSELWPNPGVCLHEEATVRRAGAEVDRSCVGQDMRDGQVTGTP